MIEAKELEITPADIEVLTEFIECSEDAIYQRIRSKLRNHEKKSEQRCDQSLCRSFRF